MFNLRYIIFMFNFHLYTIFTKITWGKKTEVFRMPQNKLINEGCCFSLVTEEYTIDFECSSRLVEYL
jgi:hypothetical protein